MERHSTLTSLSRIVRDSEHQPKCKSHERQHSTQLESLKTECSTPKYSISNPVLYSDIETLLRKLDPSFKLFISNQSPVAAILQCVRQSTTFLLQQRKKALSEKEEFPLDSLQTFICESCSKKSKLGSSQETEKLRKSMKKFEQQKLIQCEKIKEEKKILNVFKEKLEGLAERLSSQKEEILTEDRQVKKQRLTENFQISSSVKISPQARRKFNRNSVESLPVVSIESHCNFSLLFDEIEQHVEQYNKEVEDKERELNEREESLAGKQKEITGLLESLEMMKVALSVSKKNFKDVKEKYYPQIEIQISLFNKIMEEIAEKSCDLDQILLNFQEIFYKNHSKAEIFLLKSESQKKFKENCEYETYLVDMQSKLDKHYAEKNKEVQESGEKLKKLQENVNQTIEIMEKKERELLKIGENLKNKEISILKRSASFKEEEESSTQKSLMMANHSRYNKSMSNFKTLVDSN